MVVQYPDTIVVTVKTDPVQNTSTGEWTDGTSTAYTFAGRVEVNDSGKKIMGIDGAVNDFYAIFYMPKTSLIIPNGSDYVVNGITQGKVKRAKNNQMNSVIWL